MEAGSRDAEANGKGLEKLMDEYLKSKGFYRKKIAKDGSCLFRAVAEQVLHCQSRHTEVRTACVNYLKENRTKYEAFIEGNFDQYLQRLKDPQNWVGEVEISALALIYKRDFIIFQEPGKPPVNITENSFADKVRLCFLNGNHYDSVYPREAISNAAICQSILYELLYKRVYGMDSGTLDPCLKGRPDNSEDGSGECRSSEESDLEEEDDFWSKETAANTSNTRALNNSSDPPQKTSAKTHPPEILSQNVRKSLNPSLFRNVEYDVWMKTQRAQQNRDYRIAAGMQYTAGDKCKVRLDNTGRFYSAYVQEVSPNNGPVMVFIEELGQKHFVPLWNLRPPTDDPLAWSTVAEKGRKQSLANGNSPRSDWDTRARKTTKPPSQAGVTSYVSRAAGQSRTQKQNPWAPQSATEEQGSGRGPYPTSRKGDAGSNGGTPQREAHRPSAKEEQEQRGQQEEPQTYEKSFPALGSQSGPQTTAPASENGKKVGTQASDAARKVNDRRGSRRKSDQQEHSRDSEWKTTSPKTGAKGERSKLPVSATSSLKPQAPVSAADQAGPHVPELPPAAGPQNPPPAPASPAVGHPAPAAAQPSQVPAPAARVPAHTVQAARSAASPSSQQPEAPGPASSTPTQTVPNAKSVISVPCQRSQPAVSGAPTRPSPAPAPSSQPPASANTSAQSPQTPALSALSSHRPAQALPPATGPLARQSPAQPSSGLPQPHQSPAQPTSGLAQPHQSPAQPTSGLAQPHQSPAQPTSGLAQPHQSPAQPSSGLAQPHQSPAQPSSGLAQPHQSPAQPSSGLAQPHQSPAQPSSVLAQPHQSPAQPSSGLTQPHQSPAQPSSGLTQPLQSPAQPSSGLTQPLQSPAQPTSGLTQPLQSPAQPSSCLSQTKAAGPLPSALPPPASASQPPFQAGMVPTPPPQKGPPVPVSYSPLPLDHPPYDAGSGCPVGAMPQMRVSPGPAAVSLLPGQMSHSHGPSPVSHAPMAHHQIPTPYQDPLYPGFPLNEEEMFIPQPSLMRNGEDLPRDMNILRFFFNLGIKAYTHQLWPPYTYLYPLQQAYLNACAMQPKVPSPSPYMAQWMPEAPQVPSSSLPMQEGYGELSFSMAGGRPVSHFDPMHVHPTAATGMEVSGPSLGSEGRPGMGYSPQPAMQLPPQVGGMPWPRPGPYLGAYAPAPPPQQQPPPHPQFAPPRFLHSSPYPMAVPDYTVHRMPGVAPSRADKTIVKEMAASKAANVTVADHSSVSAPASEDDRAEERVATPVTDLPGAVAVRQLSSPGGCEAAGNEAMPEAPPASKAEGSSRPEDTLGERGGSEGPVGGSGRGSDVAKPPFVPHALREHYEEEGEANEAALRNGRSYYRSSYRVRGRHDDGQAFGERGWRGGLRGPYRSRRGQDSRREYTYRDRRAGEGYSMVGDKGQTGKGRSRGYSQY